VKAPLAAIAELVLRETGFALPAVRRPALLAAVRRAAPGLDPDAFLRATSDPASGRGLVDRLIDQVTNQETTFLRDRGQLDAIEWRRLARGVPTARPGTIRVWSAGCASGEEPYTLALLAAEALGPGHIPVDVLGTDISGAALAAAAVGQYRERAVHALEASLRARYFEPQADHTYLVGQRLRKLVRFRRHNLARDPIPPFGESRFDLVVCRNVLIYFEAPLAEHVIEMLRGSLRPGGVLVLGAADALPRRTAEPPLAQAGQPVRGARPGADAHSKRRPLSHPDPSPTPRRRRGSSGWRRHWMRRTRATGPVRWPRWRRCSRTIRSMLTRTSSRGWSGWPQASPRARRPHFAARSTPTPRSRSRRSRSAGATTLSVTYQPPGALTNRPCALLTRTITGTRCCSSRSTSAISPRPAGRGSPCGHEDPRSRPSGILHTGADMLNRC
jgi:chemotaxis protein methyltransferase CheR